MISGGRASAQRDSPDKKKLELRRRFRKLLDELQQNRKKKPSAVAAEHPCVDCGKNHRATASREKTFDSPKSGPPPVVPPTLSSSNGEPFLRATDAGAKRVPLAEWTPIPRSPPLNFDDTSPLPSDDDEVTRVPSSDPEDEVEERVDEMLNFQEFSPDVAQFEGNFEEYLVSLAKTSENDTDAYRRVREYIGCLPASEFALRRLGDLDDVTLTDRGLRLLCLLIHTPKSVALWNKASEYIRDQQQQIGDLIDVFLSLGPIKAGPDRKASELWSKYEFERVEDMIDVVEEAWRTASLGYKNPKDFEDEKTLIDAMTGNASGQETLARRLRLDPAVYESIQCASQETLKRKKSLSTTSSPDRERSPSRSSSENLKKVAVQEQKKKKSKRTSSRRKKNKNKV
jgi:hypothetical protein